MYRTTKLKVKVEGLPELRETVNSGLTWTALQIKSACPQKRKKLDEESSESEKSGGNDTDDPSVTPRIAPKTDSETDPKTSPYTSPGQICPPVKPRCFIKMQDPCAPCCCETKPKPLPCPPGPQEPREPICGCELCQKNPNHEKCCDKNKTLRGITIDRGYFEKA